MGSSQEDGTLRKLGISEAEKSPEKNKTFGLIMLANIIEAQPLKEHRLRIKFSDGVEGIINIKERTNFDGVFAPLAEVKYFGKVKVNSELGTFEWPNGADLDPGVLYADITGKPIVWEGHGVVYEPKR